ELPVAEGLRHPLQRPRHFAFALTHCRFPEGWTPSVSLQLALLFYPKGAITGRFPGGRTSPPGTASPHQRARSIFHGRKTKKPEGFLPRARPAPLRLGPFGPRSGQGRALRGRGTHRVDRLNSLHVCSNPR